jgi:hypothetical protein
MQTMAALHLFRRLKPYPVNRYQYPAVQYLVLIQYPITFRPVYARFEVLSKFAGFCLIRQPGYPVIARYFLRRKV